MNAPWKPGPAGNSLQIGAIVIALAVQVEGGRCNLVALKPVQPRLGALGEQGETRAGLPRRPFEQGIMAAADDRRHGLGNEAIGPGETSRHPAVERGAREQPLAGHLRAGNGCMRHQFVELALLEPQIGGGLFGGEEHIILHVNALERMNSAFARGYWIFVLSANISPRSVWFTPSWT